MAFVGEVVVAFLDHLSNVVRELLTDVRVDDVDDPLPREAVTVALLRQALLDFLPVPEHCQEDLDGQTWVERSVEMFDLTGFDV